jgi:hypothetical protein
MKGRGYAMYKNAMKSVLLMLSLCVLRLSAQTVFVEGFEGYAGSNPTLWSRSNTTLILVVTNNATDLGRTHKVATGLRSVFFRDGENRTLVLQSANAVNVSDGDHVVVSYWASQYGVAYESSDFLMLSAKFGTNAWVDVVKDAGQFDGGGTPGIPLAYTGTRIDLPNADGFSTDFKAYWVKLPVSPGSATLLLKFTTNSGTSNEDFWIDDIGVEVRPRPTLMTIR